MVKKKLNIKRVLMVLIILFLIFLCLGIGVFFYELSPIEKNAKTETYVVESGKSVYQIYEDLENKNYIRSALFMKLYSKLVGTQSISAGEYEINSSMSSRKIYDILAKGGKSNAEIVTITFREGKNVRDFINLLGSETNISESDVLNKLSDVNYLDSLISKYWFLTDDIKNEDIYYSLEGYLFPNTYEIYKDASLEDIITKMLDETDRQLSKIKSQIEESSYSVHELLTLASIVELEASNKSDKKTIAGVFTNRLNDNWSLGSCVSTYYAFKINMGDRDLLLSEIEDCNNPYNTRCTSLIGLPVGPIGNAGIESIEAALNPEETDYYYFLSDKYGNTYFSHDEEEHDRKGRELRENGEMLYN